MHNEDVFPRIDGNFRGARKSLAAIVHGPGRGGARFASCRGFLVGSFGQVEIYTLTYIDADRCMNLRVHTILEIFVWRNYTYVICIFWIIDAWKLPYSCR